MTSSVDGRDGWVMSPLFAWRLALKDFGNPPLGAKCTVATLRHVGMMLSMHMNSSGGSCHPSVVRLSNETGLSERAVRYGLRALEAGGWIVRVGVVKSGPCKGQTRWQASVPEPWRVAAAESRAEWLAEDGPQAGENPVDEAGENGYLDLHHVHPPAPRAGLDLHHVQPRTFIQDDTSARTNGGGQRAPVELAPMLLPAAIDSALAGLEAGETFRLHVDRLLREGFPEDVVLNAIDGLAASGEPLTPETSDAAYRKLVATAVRALTTRGDH